MKQGSIIYNSYRYEATQNIIFQEQTHQVNEFIYNYSFVPNPSVFYNIENDSNETDTKKNIRNCCNRENHDENCPVYRETVRYLLNTDDLESAPYDTYKLFENFQFAQLQSSVKPIQSHSRPEYFDIDIDEVLHEFNSNGNTFDLDEMAMINDISMNIELNDFQPYSNSTPKNIAKSQQILSNANVMEDSQIRSAETVTPSIYNFNIEFPIINNFMGILWQTNTTYQQLNLNQTSVQVCSFCKNSCGIIGYHTVKDKFGRIACPLLLKCVCTLCGLTAHTAKYCPYKQFLQKTPHIKQ